MSKQRFGNDITMKDYASSVRTSGTDRLLKMTTVQDNYGARHLQTVPRLLYLFLLAQIYDKDSPPCVLRTQSTRIS